MKTAKYRFNRKLGKVFLDENSQLTEVGDSLSMIILWVSEPVWGKPFEYMPPQHWVQMTFVDDRGNWSFTVLNDGITNALAPWVEYRKQLEAKNLELMSVITTIGFDENDGKNQWFDYRFSGIQGSPGLADRMRNVIHGVDFPLIEPLGLVKDRFSHD